MPATVPACWGSRWSSRLMRGRAREMLVRSIKAMVYITSATGMMRVQREGAALAEVGAGGTFAGAKVCEAGSIGLGLRRLRHRLRPKKERVGWYHGSNGVKFCAGSRASCSRGTRKRGQLVSLWVTLDVRARNDFGA